MLVASTDAVIAVGNAASTLHAVLLVFKLVTFSSEQGLGHLLSHTLTPESC